jgi:hypothetical protein
VQHHDAGAIEVLWSRERGANRSTIAIGIGQIKENIWKDVPFKTTISAPEERSRFCNRGRDMRTLSQKSESQIFWWLWISFWEIECPLIVTTFGTIRAFNFVSRNPSGEIFGQEINIIIMMT